MHKTYLNVMPYELKEILLSYLNVVTILSIVEVDEEFKQIFYSENFIKRYKQCNLDLSCNFQVNAAILKRLVKNNLHLTSVRSINLNGIYWICAKDLRDFIKRFKQLRFLALLGTEMGTHEEDFKIYNSLENLELLMINITGPLKRLPVNSGANIKMYAICKKCRKQLYACMAEKIKYTLSFRASTYPYRKCQNYVSSYYYLNKFTNAVLRKENMSEFESIIGANVDKLLYSEYQEKVRSGTSNPFERFQQSTALHIVREKLVLMKYDSTKRVYNTNGFISLMGIDVLVNLQKLDIDILPHVDPNVLKTIFEGCGMLSFLKIRNRNPKLDMSHIRHAVKLKEFSYDGNRFDFPLHKFLRDIMANPSIEFSRLSIEFESRSEVSIDLIESFLIRNPELILFFLCCNLDKSEIGQMQRMLNKYQKLPQQIFRVRNPTDNIYTHVQQLPLIHADMRNLNYFDIHNRLSKS